MEKKPSDNKKIRGIYNSPIGEITVITSETDLLFLGFTGQRHFEYAMKKLSPAQNAMHGGLDSVGITNIVVGEENSITHKNIVFGEGNPVIHKNIAFGVATPNISQHTPLAETFRWLDVYFSGTQPDFTPPLSPIGTDFQKLIWGLLLKIPYGTTTTYGEIADEAAKIRGVGKMSNRAVGNAVGKNPISLIIPCHRVIGKNGSLTGYAGGLDRKEFLVELESGK